MFLLELTVLLLATRFRINSCAKSSLPEEVWRWSTPEFDWPNDKTEAEYRAKGLYVPENNAIAGIKIFKDDVYVTVPRWRHGVPSTLNRIVQSSDGRRALLQPFPNWEMQELTNCNALQYVQSMEIDSTCALMYIIDVGRVNIFESVPVNTCPPKLVIYDLNRNEVVRVHVFPDAVASHRANFLNDIVVDRRNRFVYVSDAAGVNASGGIVAYGYDRNSAVRFVGPSTRHEINAETVTINHVTYRLATPSDGIALTPDGKELFYCALSGYRVYKVATDLLRTLKDSFEFNEEVLELSGTKVSQSDGLVFSRSERLYFGALANNSIYTWNKEKNGLNFAIESQHLLTRNDTTMEWVDTFAFDGKGYLWFVTNRLDRYIAKTMNLDDINFRVMRIYTNETSYLNSDDDDVSVCPNSEAIALTKPASISHKWKLVDYHWPSRHVREIRIAEGTYIPTNSMPADIDFHGENTFIVVPRLKPGVPSTLNQIDNNNNNLVPFPSWDMQELGNCSAFQSVESIEISEYCNLTWVLDSGGVGYWDPDDEEMRSRWQPCQPKLVAINMTVGSNSASEHVHVFTDLHKESYLTDLVIDRHSQFAYIANSGRNANGTVGSVIAYDFRHNKTREYYTKTGLGPMVALALSPDTTILYWTSANSSIYSIRTISLGDFSLENGDIEAEQVLVSSKTFPSAGITSGSSGRLYFGAQTLNSVYTMPRRAKNDLDEETSPTLLLRNNSAMRWPEKFAFDSKGNLYVVANRREEFLKGNLDWNEWNFFVWKLPVADSSYTESDYVKTAHCPGHHEEHDQNLNETVLIFTVTIVSIIAVAIAVFIALLVGGQKAILRKKKGKETLPSANTLTKPLVEAEN